MGQIYVKKKTEFVCGCPKKETEHPEQEAVNHPELGLLKWELKDGTVVICRSYHEYRQKVRE